LLKFGQLLEPKCEAGAGARCFCNVTNLAQCVDVDRLGKSDFGDIRLDAFDESKVPKEAAVFKDAASRPTVLRVETGFPD
jgi:hypothetical protein